MRKKTKQKFYLAFCNTRLTERNSNSTSCSSFLLREAVFLSHYYFFLLSHSHSPPPLLLLRHCSLTQGLHPPLCCHPPSHQPYPEPRPRPKRRIPHFLRPL